MQNDDRGGAKLMTAYRLHFEAANLDAINIAQSGKLGKLRFFNAVFSTPVKDPNNIRLRHDTAGGPLYDLGIYCINAARYLFRDEPLEVFAVPMRGKEARWDEVPEMVSAILKFPDDRMATFTASFGGSDCSEFTLVGTTGVESVQNAFDYAMPMDLYVMKDGKEKQHKHYPMRDQFAPELLHFSECILTGKKPEPCGNEGMADIRVIEALHASMRAGRPVSLLPPEALDLKPTRPSPKLKTTKPRVKMPDLVHVSEHA